MPNNVTKPGSLTVPAAIIGVFAVIVTLLMNQDQKIEDHREQKIHPDAGERMSALETKITEDEKRLDRMEARNNIVHDKFDEFLLSEYLKNKK